MGGYWDEEAVFPYFNSSCLSPAMLWSSLHNNFLDSLDFEAEFTFHFLTNGLHFRTYLGCVLSWEN